MLIDDKLIIRCNAIITENVTCNLHRRSSPDVELGVIDKPWDFIIDGDDFDEYIRRHTCLGPCSCHKRKLICKCVFSVVIVLKGKEDNSVD